MFYGCKIIFREQFFTKSFHQKFVVWKFYMGECFNLEILLESHVSKHIFQLFLQRTESNIFLCFQIISMKDYTKVTCVIIHLGNYFKEIWSNHFYGCKMISSKSYPPKIFIKHFWWGNVLFLKYYSKIISQNKDSSYFFKTFGQQFFMVAK